MNSTEHLDHTAETNNSLLFPTLFKQTWELFKKKWGTLFVLSLIPIIFGIASYTIIATTIYITMRIFGGSDLVPTIQSLMRFAPQLLMTIFSVSGLVIVLGMVYFGLRSTVAFVKVLESESKITVRHAWHGISFKNILELFFVLVSIGIIFVGGYVLLFVPLLFLATFYINSIFTNLIDGKKGVDALVVSRNYVKGYGAIVFVNLLVIFGLACILGLLFRFVLGLAAFVFVGVYFGKLSLIAAILIAVGMLVLAIALVVLWKSFSFVFMYLMFKKLKSLKAHHEFNLSEGRKAVKIWLIISIVTVAIFVGVTTALNHGLKNQEPVTRDDLTTYKDQYDFTGSNDSY